MGYVPANAKWWLADLVVEFTFEGESGNLVHYNLILVRAGSAEEAYAKSLKFGAQNENTFTNSEGKLTTVRFRGLRDLHVIHEELEDGAELIYEEHADVPEERLAAIVKDKDELAVFQPWVDPGTF